MPSVVVVGSHHRSRTSLLPCIIAVISFGAHFDVDCISAWTGEVVAIDTRERILQAAGDVAVREGVINVTLEAVAKEAGLSKGGLLYHFPNKEALVSGLVERFVQHFEGAIAAAISRSADRTDTIVPEAGGTAAPDGGTPKPPGGDFTRAFIEATFDESPAPQALYAGLLAAILLNPALLAGFQLKFARWHEQIRNDGLDPTTALLLRYAADGIWASELLGLAPPTDEEKAQLRALMLQLAGGSA